MTDSDDGCPSCGAPYTQATSTHELSIDHDSAGQAKTCITARAVEDDDAQHDAMCVVVFHTAEDLAGAGADVSITDLDDTRRMVYEMLRDQSEPVSLTELQGLCANLDIGPQTVAKHVDALVDDGLVAEVGDDVAAATAVDSVQT